MTLNKTTTAKNILLGGMLFATLFAIGCNSGEKKDAKDTPIIINQEAPPVIVAPDTMVVKHDTLKLPMKRDTAVTRPTKTPTK